MDNIWYKIIRDILALIGGGYTIGLTFKFIIKKIKIVNINKGNINLETSNQNNLGSIKLKNSHGVILSASYHGTDLKDILPILKENNEDVFEKTQELIEKNRKENISSVLNDALKNIDSNSIPIDEDWMNRFYDYASQISDKQLQSLWSKLLSGQSNKPNSFSLKTLDVVRNLAVHEAKIFQKISNLVDHEGLLYKNKDGDISEYIPYIELLELIEAGILNEQSLLTKFHIIKPNNESNILFKDFMIMMKNKSANDIKVDLGVYKLSKAGMELLSISNYNTDFGYLNSLSHLIKDTYPNIEVSLHKVNFFDSNGNINYDLVDLMN